MLIVPAIYFGPIFYYGLISGLSKYQVDGHEHFVKQSYRSRCEIYGANGRLNLIVPLKKWKNHSLTKDIEISYDSDWQTLHWRSIESAYRTSPYFEFYEEDVKPLFFLEEENLLSYNLQVEKEIKDLLGMEAEATLSSSYQRQEEIDWRSIIHPKTPEMKNKITFPEYIQVFQEKFGFLPNLSILDLLFNLGPNSKSYLENLSKTTWQRK